MPRSPPAQPVSELSVLKPIDPAIAKSEDDYEIYTLTNAQVFYMNGRQAGRHASLLDAYADTPLRVEGRLEHMERGKNKFLVKKSFRPVDVEICDVTRYSYGQTEDGDIIIWALGQAGWFELRPARSYKEVFEDMVQAVEILYFVSDIYNEPRKKGGGPSAGLIFQEYAETEQFACKDVEEAQRIFNRHKAFLIMCFLNKAQDIGWSNTPLYQSLKKKFPQDFETARARIEGKPVPKTKGEPAKAIQSTTRTPAREKSKVKKTSDAPRKDDNWWGAAAIFAFMQKAVNMGVMHIGHVTIDKVSKLLARRYEIDDVETARKVILVHATNLCYMMDHPRRKNIQFFASEPFYKEISAGHNLPAAEIRRIESIELRPRKDYSSLREEADSESESDTSSMIETPKARPRRSKKGRLSVLRPKGSKFSGKGKSVKPGKGKGKAPSTNITSGSEGEGEEGQDQDAASEDEPFLDTPTQALSPGKRKLDADDLIGALNPKKRAGSASAEQEDPASESEDLETPTEPLPLQWRSRNAAAKSSSTIVPPVISSPLPTFTANGPGDSWLCEFDGCTQKVYGASTELGRGLIEQHMQDHAGGRQREVALVLKEEQRLRLPVNNLIKRIREMSELQQNFFPSGPSSPSLGPVAVSGAQPAPIQRMA